MAREERAHEDLFQVATALVERLAIGGPSFPEVWVIGFRNDQAASVYMGADPVYHFTAAGALRRAYVDGKLLKAEQGHLVEMVRVRTDATVELRSRNLTEAESTAFLQRLANALARLQSLWQQGEVAVTNQFPNPTVAPRVQQWLADLPRSLTVASQPGSA